MWGNRVEKRHDYLRSSIAQDCFPDEFRGTDVWRVLGQDDIDWINKIAICKRHKASEILFVEGDNCSGVYLICEGLVAIRKISSDGKSVLMRLAKPGDLLGYRPFLAAEPHRATADFLKSGRACFLKSALMHELLLKQPLFGFELVKRISQDLGEAEERFNQVVTKGLRARLAHWLLLMKEPYGTTTADGKFVLELPISRRDMAEMLGVRSESLSRAIHQMTEDGVLRFSGHRAWIDEPDRLIRELP
jgi:CRP-like cAMP-binding protein